MVFFLFGFGVLFLGGCFFLGGEVGGRFSVFGNFGGVFFVIKCFLNGLLE